MKRAIIKARIVTRSKLYEKVYYTVLSSYLLNCILKIKAPSKKNKRPQASNAKVLTEILELNIIYFAADLP